VGQLRIADRVSLIAPVTPGAFHHRIGKICIRNTILSSVCVIPVQAAVQKSASEAAALCCCLAE
jgi:hypothetical protein